jgi:hypothetical protein
MVSQNIEDYKVHGDPVMIANCKCGKSWAPALLKSCWGCGNEEAESIVVTQEVKLK